MSGFFAEAELEGDNGTIPGLLQLVNGESKRAGTPLGLTEFMKRRAGKMEALPRRLEGNVGPDDPQQA